ncbi:LOW QUALITY PROTEIN: hypothetical protein M513_11969, partial [Trichuris suis]
SLSARSAARNDRKLSDCIQSGRPRLATKRRKASRKFCVVKLGTSSKCIALVTMQADIHFCLILSTTYKQWSCKINASSLKWTRFCYSPFWEICHFWLSSSPAVTSCSDRPLSTGCRYRQKDQSGVACERGYARFLLQSVFVGRCETRDVQPAKVPQLSNRHAAALGFHDLTSSLRVFSFSVGHILSEAFNQLGPCHQRLIFRSFVREQPRLSKSAGLSLVGQYRQAVGSDKAIVLSVQQTIRGSETFSSLLTNWTKRAPSTVAVNSKRGIVTSFDGATLAFDISSSTELSLGPRLTFRYTTAPYAIFDASQKTCSSMFSAIHVAPIPTHRGIRMSLLACMSAFHFCHLLFKLLGITVSQSTFSFHNVCSNIFATTVKGATKPSGSKIRAAHFNKDRFVSGSVWSATASGQLLVHFFKSNPPLFKSFLASSETDIASSNVRSSTYIFCLTAAAPCLYASALSSACLFTTAIAKKGEQVSPKQTRVKRQTEGVISRSNPRHKKRTKSRSSSCSRICMNIFSMSACTATLKRLNRSKIPTRSACSGGPASNKSFSATPL